MPYRIGLRSTHQVTQIHTVKIYASEGLVTLECECGLIERLPPFKTKRAFMLRFNKFVRKHEWQCAPRIKVKKQWDDAGDKVNALLEVLRR